jgi:hypothetical protein
LQTTDSHDNVVDETGSNNGVYTVTLSNQSSSATTVSYTVSGTATSGTDFTALSGTVTIPANTSSAVINLTILTDVLVEADETVIVTLTGITAGDAAIAVDTDNDEATITIPDNDNAVVSINDPAAVTEGTNIVFKVTLDAEVEDGFTLAYTTISGTATGGGSDFINASGTITFAGTENEEHEITITTINDVLLESTESFTLVLGAITNTTANVTVSGINGEGTGTINDNDAASLSISDVVITEGADAEFEVTLSGNVQGSFTINYATADGSATDAGGDYSNDSGTLIFAGTDGESYTITISTNDDSYLEAVENFVVNLSSISNALVTFDNEGNAILNDNDSAELTVSDQTVTEGGNLTFTVTLNANVQGAFTIDFATNNASAVAPGDYTAASGTLSFTGTAGEFKTVIISTVNNSILEPEEKFELNFTNISNTLVSFDTQAIGTITDNDPATLSLTGFTATEGDVNTTGNFTVSISRQAQEDITVNFSVTEGTAFTTSDYVVTNLNATIPAGSLSVTLPITIVGDLIAEGQESFTAIISESEYNGQNVIEGTMSRIITINDNDAALVTVNSPDAVEEGNTITFTVTVDKAVQGGFEVTYSTSDISAIQPGDYTEKTGTLTFAGNAGESKTFTVNTVEDAVRELSETFIANLDAIQATSANVSISSGSGTGTITDDDAAGISIADVIVAENNVNGYVTFEITLSGDVQESFAVNYTTSNVSAISGSDYTLSTGTISFDANSADGTIKTFNVPINNDAVVEGSETFTVTLSGITGGLVTIDNASATATITDDDEAVVSINNPAGVVEGGNIIFTVTVDKAVQGGFKVNYATNDGTATIAGSDYTDNDGQVSFTGLAGETKTITIATNDDAIAEGTELLSVELTSIQDNSGTVTISGSNGTGSGSILDSDLQVIASIAATTQAAEDAINGLFTITIDKALSTALTVNLVTSGTATNGTDMNTMATSVTIPAGSLSVTTPVTVISDAIAEGTESVILTLGANSGAPAGVTVENSGTDNAATVNITDNDLDVEVSIAATAQAAEDATNGLFTISVDKALSTALTVNLVTSGTATNGTDMNTMATSVTIPAGSLSVTTPVTVISDAIAEGTESVILTLGTNSGAPAGVTVENSGTDNAATVTIADNDASEVTIAATTQASEEGPADGLFTLTLSNPVSVETTVTFTVTGTAAEGSDYAAIGTTVVFPAMSTAQTIAVAVTQDNIVETGGETVTVTLAGTNTAVTVGAGNAATVTIADNDASEVTIAATTQASEEGPADGLFTLTLSNPVSVETTVTFSVTGTAAEGSDYAAIGTTVVFPAMSTAQTIAVAVTQDNIVETGGETVTVTLAGTNTAVTVGAGNAATVTIADNDASEVTIAATTQASEEGPADGLFTLTLSNPVSVETTVTFSVTGTAAEGSDYAAIGTTVVFPAMSTAQTIAVAVTQDNIVETGGETVTVTLAGTNTAVTVGAGNAATVTIADNDASEVTIAATTQASEEGPADGLFTLTLSNPVSVETTVTFSVTGTAAEGSDYAAIGTTVVFPAMSTAQTIAVAVTQDNIVETGGETVTVTLAGTNTAVTVGAGNAATVTIADNDASEVTIAATTQASEEGPADGLFTLTLSNPVSVETTVTFTVTGTAAEGSDYAAIGTTVVFPAMSTAQTIAVAVTQDNIVETGGETVTVTLAGTNTAVTVGAGNAATVTIADNDASEVTIAATTQASEEGPADGLFTLTLSNPVSVETTVTFTVTGTAAEGSDYAAIGTTVVFPAMSTAQTIAVAVTQDNIVETGGETVTVTLAGTNTAVTVGAGNAATVTIADNDASEVTIAATTQASEEGPADGLFTLTLSNPVSVETTVTFTVTGTAAEGSDYAAIGTTVVFPAMSTAQTIAVAVTQDNIVETGGETVTVTLAGTNTAVTVGAGNAATVTIADNDASEVTIAATTQASEEGPADGLFTLTLSNPVSVETTVTFTVTGTATEGSDYAAIGTTVVFPAMSTAQTIAVAVTQDNIVETGGETVTVTLAGTNTAVTVGAGNAATVTIADNDASEVTIAATTQASEEGPADGLFTLTLSNPVSVETTVTFTVTGTAAEGSDYAAIGTTVVFPCNVNSANHCRCRYPGQHRGNRRRNRNRNPCRHQYSSNRGGRQCRNSYHSRQRRLGSYHRGHDTGQ